MDIAVKRTRPERPTPESRKARRSGRIRPSRLVLAPTFVITLVFIYGYILWTAVLSFTPSRMLPNYKFAGVAQYEALFANDRWWLALKNLMIFGGCFIGFCLVVGLLLAVLLDQRVRAEGAIRRHLSVSPWRCPSS